jgi:hypothetical protein
MNGEIVQNVCADCRDRAKKVDQLKKQVCFIFDTHAVKKNESKPGPPAIDRPYDDCNRRGGEYVTMYKRVVSRTLPYSHSCFLFAGGSEYVV